MIDYNLYPSFILSKKPSYELMDTVSSDLYSTEYALYADLIQELYGEINEVQSKVAGYEWTDRKVLESGVIVNSYENNGKTKEVVVNYTSNAISYNGHTVEAQSASVIE
jgi:hypothetical protein